MGMGAVKELLVRVRANTADLDKKLNRSARRMASVGRRMEQMGETMSRRVTLPILGVGLASLKMAADAEETENLFTVSMGEMEASAREFSERLRSQLGLNAYAVREQVGTFQSMFTAMGIGEQAAFQMGSGLTQLTADLASFRNLKMDEAFEKLQSGIMGEAEPLRRLGILVDETTIKQYAMKHGLIEQGEEMSQQQKVIARYIAIVEQTRKAQGDMARTMDSPTNRFRQLTNVAKEVGIALGNQLLPIALKVMNGALSLAKGVKALVYEFQQAPQWVKTTTMAIIGLAAAAGPLLKISGMLLSSLGNMPSVLALITSPVGQVAAVIGGLAFVATTFIQNWDAVKVRWTLVWAAIKDAVFRSVGGILEKLEGLTSWIPGVGQRVAALRAGFDEWADDSMTNAGRRLAELERQLLENYTPALDQAGVSVDEFKLSLEELLAAFLGMKNNAKSAKEQVEDLEETLRNSPLARSILLPGEQPPTLPPNKMGDVIDRNIRKTARWKEELGSGMARTFETLDQGFKAFAKNFLSYMSRMIARLVIFRALASVFSPFAGGGGIGGAMFSAFNAPFEKRAAGGPVLPGRTYLVGERGPELIRPQSPGFVVPNHQLAGAMGGPSVSFSFDVSRMPAASNPLAAARDADWVRFIHETLLAWESGGGRFNNR